MDPILVVTAALGVMYIAARGPLLVRPAKTVALYRRAFATSGRIRLFGILLALLAVILVVTAMRAGSVYDGLDILIQIIGWLSAIASMWVLIAPQAVLRMKEKLWSSSDPVLRLFGAVNIGWGLWLCWIAFVCA